MTAPILMCDWSEVVTDHDIPHVEEVDCHNAATGCIYMPTSDPVGDEGVEFESQVILHCDDHAAELMHEAKQMCGINEAIFGIQFASVQQVQ